ncbi:unnamed protein product [Heligmosomoides polygyrus]|uniref:Uncharacterized protein n=1 Tax=Heligmosomoides polygyrus TaxID=6339 RepID=A0A183F224_HELPZ|nr:unnamed protein product [Heligmosomoides polygyrus]
MEKKRGSAKDAISSSKRVEHRGRRRYRELEGRESEQLSHHLPGKPRLPINSTEVHAFECGDEQQNTESIPAVLRDKVEKEN